MRFERSAGFVVFYVNENTNEREPLYLILHYEEGHWDFPKGHIEEGEDELAAAKRELMEETSLNVEVIPGFKESFSYFFRAKYLGGELVKKEVVYFLGKANSTDVSLSHEHVGFAWLPYSEAVKRITYDNSKELLSKAHKFIKERLAF